jgi:SPP1 gp7 family putative phage head morphogenesis protein
MRAYIPPELRRARKQPTAAEKAAMRLADRQHWLQVRRAETIYESALRTLARQVGDMIGTFKPDDPQSLDLLSEMLHRYSWIIEPWANVIGERMVGDVMKRDAAAWFKVSRAIGLNLRRMIDTAPVGFTMRKLIDDQVHLIRDIPLEAGRQIQKHAQDYVVSGLRYDTLIDRVQDIIPATVNRARLIARTETAKAQSAIVQARALHIGSERYYWRSVRDTAVRDKHRELDARSRKGETFAWADPPEAEEPRADGTRIYHHPGQFPNCRCFAQPVLPEAQV